MIGADLAVLFCWVMFLFLDGSSNRVEASTDLEAKVMIISSITKDGLSESKVDSCWVCSLRVKVKLISFKFISLIAVESLLSCT